MRRRRTRVALAGLLAGVLAGCVSVQPLAVATPTPPPPTPTPTMTFPTIVPTATFTPVPSPTPTPDITVGLGQRMFFDTFAEDRGWQVAPSRSGGISLIAGRLSLAVNQPNASLFALSPAKPIADAYVEVLARPEICAPDDEYGIFIRQSAPFTHLRFTLTCGGEVRLIRGSESGDVALVPLTKTYALLPGPLIENRLAVYASAKELQFAVNGVLVFSAIDRFGGEGGIGLIVHTRRGGQTTVSFDDFSVRALSPTPSPLATEAP